MTDLRFTTDLRAMLAAHLGGFERRSIPVEGLRPAAVAVVVVPDAESRASIVLTVRAAGLRRHGGQWACPGGRLEPGETAEAAAPETGPRAQSCRRQIATEVGIPDSSEGRGVAAQEPDGASARSSPSGVS